MHGKGHFWLCTINLLASWNSLLYNKNRKYADAERWKSAMPKLRKTLGDIQSETCRSLMRLIETQSKTTLARWAIGYAQERYLPICQETCPGLWEIVSQCQDAVEQKQPVSHCKSQIRLAADMARCCTGAAEQAAARAVAVACATMQTPSNALGFRSSCGGLCKRRTGSQRRRIRRDGSCGTGTCLPLSFCLLRSGGKASGQDCLELLKETLTRLQVNQCIRTGRRI